MDGARLRESLAHPQHLREQPGLCWRDCQAAGSLLLLARMVAVMETGPVAHRLAETQPARFTEGLALGTQNRRLKSRLLP